MSRDGFELGQPTDLVRGDLDGDRSERPSQVFEFRAIAVRPIAIWCGSGDLAVIDEWARESRPARAQRDGELVTKLVDGDSAYRVKITRHSG